MKWYKFSKKMPKLGTNILLSTKDKEIALIEFNLIARKYIKYFIDNGSICGNGLAPDFLFVDDDPENDRFYTIESAEYWAYPSAIKLPKP